MTAPIAALSEVIDDRTVASADGTRIDLPEAIERLPWKTSFCATMPHQYVVSSWEDCDPAALDAILAMIRGSRQTVARLLARVPDPDPLLAWPWRLPLLDQRRHLPRAGRHHPQPDQRRR